MSIIAPVRAHGARNRLLDRLSAADRGRIVQNATVYRFSAGQRIEVDGPGAVVFLPTSGALSVRVTDGRDHGTEVALIGNEGAIEPGRALPPEPLEVIAMTSGEALRYRPHSLALADREADEALGEMLAAYREVFVVTTAFAALAAARCSVAARLARWLLMCFDRIDGDSLPITHEALADALGVRRPGITVATHEIEGVGAIRARRGLIHLLDRSLLEQFVPSCYGEPERAYRRAFPSLPKSEPATIAEGARAAAF